jgi:hypothetical protein
MIKHSNIAPPPAAEAYGLRQKAWAARRPKSAPEPTAPHLNFIGASEEGADARSSAQRKQLEEMAAAQAERETALHKAEEALKKTAPLVQRLHSCRTAMSAAAV